MDFNSWTPEYVVRNEEACLQHLEKSEVRSLIPLLNCTQLHHLRDNSLVRFRGMIQDMQDPECYLEGYEVRSAANGSLIRVQNGKYRDILVLSKEAEAVDFKSSSNKYGERSSMFVISAPALNDWAIEQDEKNNEMLLGQTSTRSTVGSTSVKRPHEIDTEMETDDEVSHHGTKKLNTVVAPPADGAKSAPQNDQKVLSAEYLLNSPIPERPSKACLVKLYKGYKDLPLNALVDVVGFLSVDPALDGSSDQIDGFDDEMSEHQATHPPPSLIPRIHAISVQKLRHLNPLVLEENQSHVTDVWRDIHNLLTQCLFGDKVAADYLFCHLLSTVYIRSELESLGQFSLNLSNIPAEVVPHYTKSLYEMLALLLPASHYFPMTLENMNTTQFVPKKDYVTNKLTSGLLQLAPHTLLLLDETKLQTGKLENSGVVAIQSIANLIKSQKLKYNFQFYQLEFDSDVPVLVLSEGKSMLPTNCFVPILPDTDAIKLIDETFKAGKHFIQSKLNDMRKFLTIQRIQQFEMKDFDPEIIQNDFVQMRKDNNASADDLHSLIVLSRLIGLSRGKRVMDQECWEHAKQLEQERKTRIQDFTKQKNEM